MGGKRRRLMVARAWEYLMEFPMAKVIRKPVIRKGKILCGYNNRYVKLSSIFKKEIGKRKIIFLCLGCGASTDEERSELVIEFGSELLLEKSSNEEILLEEENKEEEEEEEEEEEKDEECVDKRAEEFIERFYKKMTLERQQSLENLIRNCPRNRLRRNVAELQPASTNTSSSCPMEDSRNCNIASRIHKSN